MSTKRYLALKTFFHQNFRCDAGAEVDLTTEQAEYLVHGGFVEPVRAQAAPAESQEVQAADEPKRRKGALA